MNESTRLGYCCINLSLADRGVTANRGMVKKTFQQRGPAYCGELALKNLQDIETILLWNLGVGIHVYRMSSDIFPWMSEYSIDSLPNVRQIRAQAERIGAIVHEHGLRVSMHPGQFNVLGSPTADLVTKTVWDLDQHSRIMDMMCLPATRKFPINIHIGGTYGDKGLTSERFCANYGRLNESTKRRLVVENDDKGTQYSVQDLHDQIWSRIGTSITFDYHHHRFNTSDLSESDALALACSTWEEKPLMHYSSCRKTFEDESVNPRAHADYIYEKINTYGRALDIDVEAKAKDLAVLKYRKDHETLLENYINFNGTK